VPCERRRNVGRRRGTLQGSRAKARLGTIASCFQPRQYSARASAYRPIRSKTCQGRAVPAGSRDRSPRLTVSRDRFVEPAVHTVGVGLCGDVLRSFGRSLWACGETVSWRARRPGSALARWCKFCAAAKWPVPVRVRRAPVTAIRNSPARFGDVAGEMGPLARFEARGHRRKVRPLRKTV